MFLILQNNTCEVKSLKQIVPEIYIKDCTAALEVYKKIFGGEVKNMQLSDDLPTFKEMHGKVIHSELHVNNKCVFYFVDIFEPKRQNPGNVTLVLHMDSKAELDRCYTGLSEGGKVGMPLQKTFWGAWHAIVTDRFGAPWALSLSESKT